jgi:cobalamin 5'-phosphate synthase/cobalamin synthase
VAAVLVVALDALLTGALHLDGLADMADGFGGGKTRDDVLRIMRDHSIGSYGAVALILTLLLKAVCLSNLLGRTNDFWILFTAPAISRWSILLLSTNVPYARAINDGPIGTGAMSRSITQRDLLFGTALCLPLLLFPGPVRTLICWVASAACTACLARICRQRIGGFTGDVLGANTVLSEALQFVIAIMVSQA